jgi:hypothetical protein
VKLPTDIASALGSVGAVLWVMRWMLWSLMLGAVFSGFRVIKIVVEISRYLLVTYLFITGKLD